MNRFFRCIMLSCTKGLYLVIISSGTSFMSSKKSRGHNTLPWGALLANGIFWIFTHLAVLFLIRNNLSIYVFFLSHNNGESSWGSTNGERSRLHRKGSSKIQRCFDLYLAFMLLHGGVNISHNSRMHLALKSFWQFSGILCLSKCFNLLMKGPKRLQYRQVR